MYKKLTILTIILLIIDRISKILVESHIYLNHSIKIINNFFNLTYVRNTGAAFSIFEGWKSLFIVVGVVALILIFIFFIKDKNLKKIEIIMYPLLIAGIIGNMIDRILYGYVIDFLDFKIFGHNFAIFNLADSFIVISVVLLLITMLGEEKCKHI